MCRPRLSAEGGERPDDALLPDRPPLDGCGRRGRVPRDRRDDGPRTGRGLLQDHARDELVPGHHGVFVAFGFVSRIARGAVEELREEGVKAGLFRPQTLWPFDNEGLEEAAKNAKFVVVLEGNAGMMCKDVRLFLGKDKPILLNGRMGGNNVNGESVKEKIKQVLASGNYEEWREYDGKQGVWKTFVY